MTKSPVFLEQSGPVASLVLNRSERKNALTESMWETIPGLIETAIANPDNRLLVVRGEGGTFAAGADIGEFESVYATPERAAAYSRKIAAALDALAAYPLPSIARIDGPCIGGGCGLALACDFRIATDRSRFGITPAKLGLAYPLNDTRRLIATVGLPAAKDLLFTGRLLDTAEAETIGLVDTVVSPDALNLAVDHQAAALLKASSSTARITKKMIRMIETGPWEDNADSHQLFLDAFQSEDFARGYRAFIAKQKPDFSEEDET